MVIELSGVQFGLKSYAWLYSSIFWVEKVRVLEKKWQNLPYDTLCLSFSYNLIGYFKQALESDWLFCFKCGLLIGWEKDVI